MLCKYSEKEITAEWVGSVNEPIVSVCCITYNHADFIEEALCGILSQRTDFPFELLINDDASTDGTSEILKKYAEVYPSIVKLIIQPSNQYMHAININPSFNFPRAKGKYIAICEGDDYWVDPLKLKKQVAFLNENPDCSIVFSKALAFSGNGLIIKGFKASERDLSSFELMTCAPIATLTACFRKVPALTEWPRDLKGSPYGDLAIWAILGKYGYGKFLTDIIPSMYRVHAGGVHSSADPDKKFCMNLKSYAQILSYHVNSGTNVEVQLRLCSKIFFLILRRYKIRFLGDAAKYFMKYISRSSKF